MSRLVRSMLHSSVKATLLCAATATALSAWLAACGGSSAASHADQASSAAAHDSPAAQCLAIADAKRDRKPNEPDAVTVSHILIEHKDARGSKAGVTRTREEACLLAQEAQKKLSAGASFTDLVGQYSDSKGVNGDGALGSVHRADLEPTFADAAFQLARGQMSDVVETPLGFHLIVRTE